MTDYVVKAGDCLSSIAHRYGYTWQALWNDPANADLKALRKNPNILFPGDVVHVPEKRPTEFAATARAWNRYVVRRETTNLRLRMRINGQAISNTAYTLTVDGVTHAGMTDGDGGLSAAISPDAKDGHLALANGPRYRLRLGSLDPIETSTGVQARLAHLGFYTGAIDGIMGAYSQAALRFFQISVGAAATGVADAKTRDALREAFGC